MPQGAAIERTRLAWRRTMLVFSVVQIVLVLTVAHRGITPVRALAIAVSLLTWLACLLISQRRIRTMDTAAARIRGDGPELPDGPELQRMAPRTLYRTVALIGFAVTVLATAGLLILP